jgi:pimeloyl-ACP methyl ester carboxylesterase
MKKTNLLLIWALFWLAISPADSWGQRNESTVTLNNGLQYEGVVFSTDSLAGGRSAYKDYGIHNIVGISDGLREIFVGFSSVNGIGASNRNEMELPIFQRDLKASEGFPGIRYIGPFNEKGHREFIMAWTPDDLVFTQGITKVHPRFCEVKVLTGSNNSKNYQWIMNIGTNTVPSDVLRSVLRNEIRIVDSPADYLQIAELFLQANRFQDARDEIEFIKLRFPELRDRLNEDLTRIRQVETRQILREIRLRKEAGQHITSHTLAKVLDKENLANEILAELSELEGEYPQLLERLQGLVRQVNTVITDAALKDDRLFQSARRLQQELETELNDINAARLDAFSRMADDTAISVQEKLALLISGWLLGSNYATENTAVAAELFEMRDLVRRYLTTAAKMEREQILGQILTFETGNPRQITALIQQMLPLNPPADLANYNGAEPLTFSVEVPRPLIDRNLPPYEVRCLVHLPTEYNPYRKYPLLLALPGNNHSADQYIDLWCGGFSPRLNQRVGHASRNGFITVVVDWRFFKQLEFGYSAFEHQAVLRALRESMRRFSVDSDRVFLAGHGVGGDAAYDIGLSHPEHWAGIVAIGGKLGKINKFNWDNKHWRLPVYNVAGSRDLSAMAANGDAWSNWVANKTLVDATVVWYTGRGNEVFLEEVPETFKWMNAQRRRWPDQTEFNIDVSLVRPWDNYYWFVEMHPATFAPEKLILPEEGREQLPSNTSKTSLKASYRQANRLRIEGGSRDMTVWLGQDFINFEEPVEIRIAGKSRHLREKVDPSVRILLEDVRQRADRERPFWARVDYVNNQWTIVQ